ncbi:ABC transporter ATP-binding protein [Amycolatopsis sp. NPDC021455]|uniref:ABC transporter ATP-binding protein n=1 Tax=Amycolatopsis sp. NPDC021455 TaxID=3154901 RepID=UPI0033E922D3
MSLRIENLTVHYGQRAVLSGIDLDVADAEILAVTGPSGCGKSTLLRTLAGLLPVSSGRVLSAGVKVTGTSAERALVFQDDGLLPWRSVRRNVELPLAIRRVPRARRRVEAEAWLTQVGLAGYEDHLPRELSGGMRQRVQLARTLAGEPRVILADEPFGALDAQTRTAMQRLLVDVWHQRPTTVVFVTHDVDEALFLADRVAVLTRDGRLAKVVESSRPRTAEPAVAAERAEVLDGLVAA